MTKNEPKDPQVKKTDENNHSILVLFKKNKLDIDES